MKQGDKVYVPHNGQMILATIINGPYEIFQVKAWIDGVPSYLTPDKGQCREA